MNFLKCCIFIDIYFSLSDIELDTLDAPAEFPGPGVGTELPPGALQPALLRPAPPPRVPVIIVTEENKVHQYFSFQP